jgi:hypothetical protein
VVALALFSIAFVALSVAASLPVFLPRTNSITATGQAFLLASMAGVFYFMARAVIAHRLLHVGKSLLWLSADRLLIPVCTWALCVRHTELRPIDVVTNPVLIALLVVLLDPRAIFGRALANAAFLKSGRFLRPVVPDRPTSSGQYFVPLLCLALLYWRLII